MKAKQLSAVSSCELQTTHLKPYQSSMSCLFWMYFSIYQRTWSQPLFQHFSDMMRNRFMTCHDVRQTCESMFFHFHKGSGQLTYDQTHRRWWEGKYPPITPHRCQPWPIRLSDYPSVLWGLFFSSYIMSWVDWQVMRLQWQWVRLKIHCMSWVSIVMDVRSDKVKPDTDYVNLEVFPFWLHVSHTTDMTCLAKSAHSKIKPELLLDYLLQFCSQENLAACNMAIQQIWMFP